MKKVNWILIVVFAVIDVAVCMIAGIIFSVIMGNESVIASGLSNGVAFVVIMAVPSLFLFNSIFSRVAKRTMKKLDDTFLCASTFHSGTATLKIDIIHGRIAYVSSLNPFDLQVISAAQIEDICSDYDKGPLGGTRYVYFQFNYNNKRVRIPTFTSRQTYSLQSGYVMTGLSKADAYAGYLKQAKENAAA